MVIENREAGPSMPPSRWPLLEVAACDEKPAGIVVEATEATPNSPVERLEDRQCWLRLFR